MSMKRYELTKEQWERIKSLLPPEEMGKRGRPRKDNPIMLNGMLWIVRSGAQWRELPETYGPWQSIYAHDGTPTNRSKFGIYEFFDFIFGTEVKYATKMGGVTL